MLFICDKVFGKFAELLSNISLHLVEVSPTLSDIQGRTLTAGSHKDKKNEKQCGATRSTAFGNEVLSGNDTACMQCLIGGCCMYMVVCDFQESLLIFQHHSSFMSLAFWDYSSVNLVCF